MPTLRRTAEPSPVAERKTEFRIVPLTGGDTDNGIGGGFIANLAGLDPAVTPLRMATRSRHLHHLQAGRALAQRVGQPLPGLLPSADRTALPARSIETGAAAVLHARVDPALLWARQRIGGAGRPRSPTAISTSARIPRFSARLRWELGREHLPRARWQPTPRTHSRWNPQSTLAADMSAGTPAVRELLGTATSHGVLLVENSLIYDTRDSEISPEARPVSPGQAPLQPAARRSPALQYGQLNVMLRFYVPLVERLGLTVRTVAATGSSATCRSTSWRATRTRSPSAAATAFAAFPASATTARSNCSRTRAEVTSARLQVVPQAVHLGRRAVHRLRAPWTELGSHPELDGSGIGLKYGLGGGARIQQGKRSSSGWTSRGRPTQAYRRISDRRSVVLA